MKILVTEQQAELIITKIKELIRLVLLQKDINISELDVNPTFYPERGIQVKVRIEDPSKKSEAREIVKDLLGGVSNFGQKKSLKVTA